MPVPGLEQFAGEKYLNLETYRRTGVAVATPVWFAQDGARLYVYSLADAGKVKRVRNNAKVRVAPCDLRGKLKGEWVAARARIIEGPEEAHGHRLLDEKYGWAKMFGNFTSRLLNRRRAVLVIELAAHQ